jgi:hypothetical protein
MNKDWTLNINQIEVISVNETEIVDVHGKRSYATSLHSVRTEQIRLEFFNKSWNPKEHHLYQKINHRKAKITTVKVGIRIKIRDKT